MAQIKINEISQNYTYNIGSNSYACVAMPITASWGPCLDLDNQPEDASLDDILENVAFTRFPATQAGLESFVSTYRGASSCYRLAKDYSYQMAMTLLSAGYDILVCRLCPGAKAQGVINISGKDYPITAKYPGTFGNSLLVVVKEVPNKHYVNIITYVVDASGIKTAVENLICTTEEQYSTDNISHILELESKFLDFVGGLDGISLSANSGSVMLSGGTDLPYASADATVKQFMDDAVKFAEQRFTLAHYADIQGESRPAYLSALSELAAENTPSRSVTKVLDKLTAQIISYREQIFMYAMHAYDLLKDKLAYNHNRIISPGWDDQDFNFMNGTTVTKLREISPFHIKLFDCAYNSRCATAFIDIPRSLARSGVYNESEDDNEIGYAQRLARYTPVNDTLDVNGTLYQSHAALFAPWGQYMYVGTSKQNIASPSFQALLIQRAMILNQSVQYEWALPTNRKHNLKLGKLDYKVPKKLLDEWQTLDGVGVNVITTIPDLGTTLWGNSTLFEVPPATYQALANLSTRYLVNAVEDVVWRCGISITYRYNNDEAYNSFYAGVTPILDTMRNVGAIEDYYVKMSADINGLDQVNANTVVGQIFLIVNGVINDIVVDLVALPPGVDLAAYQ